MKVGRPSNGFTRAKQDHIFEQSGSSLCGGYRWTGGQRIERESDVDEDQTCEDCLEKFERRENA